MFRASEIVQHVKVVATKPDNRSLIPENNMREERTSSFKLSSDPYMAHACLPTHIHTQKKIKVFNNVK